MLKTDEKCQYTVLNAQNSVKAAFLKSPSYSSPIPLM